MQEDNKETWQAFLRRIKKVFVYGDNGVQKYDSVEKYLNRSEFVPVSDTELEYIQENIFE